MLLCMQSKHILLICAAHLLHSLHRNAPNPTIAIRTMRSSTAASKDLLCGLIAALSHGSPGNKQNSTTTTMGAGNIARPVRMLLQLRTLLLQTRILLYTQEVPLSYHRTKFCPPYPLGSLWQNTMSPSTVLVLSSIKLDCGGAATHLGLRAKPLHGQTTFLTHSIMQDGH